MTYSGLLMLVIGVALARVLFGSARSARGRRWCMPALAVAVALTFTRSAAVGACAGARCCSRSRTSGCSPSCRSSPRSSSRSRRDRSRKRFASMFDLNDPTSRDRVAMLREGEHMIRAHPLTGVGPNMVQRRLRASTRGARRASTQINPHLHNVPLQIAAERGLPALARLAVVHRRAARSAIWFAASGDRLQRDARRGGAGHGRRDARGRPVRVQLRRLRSS